MDILKQFSKIFEKNLISFLEKAFDCVSSVMCYLNSKDQQKIKKQKDKETKKVYENIDNVVDNGMLDDLINMKGGRYCD